MGLVYRHTLERLTMVHKAKEIGQLLMRIVLSKVSDGTYADQAFIVWVKSNYPLFEATLFPRGGWIGQVDGPSAKAEAVGCVRWFDVSITATGKVAHCCMDAQAAHPVGDVRDEHVLEIYNKPAFRRYRSELSTRVDASPCRECGFL